MKKLSSSRLGLCIEYLAVIALSAIIAYFYLGFSNIDMSYPVAYGSDGMTILADIKKQITDGGAALGYPIHTDTASYKPIYDGGYRLFVKLCGLFTDNFGLIGNLFRLTAAALNITFAYAVLRQLSLRRWLSYLLALTYGLAPYVHARINQHIFLATIEMIPIAFLICFWLYEDGGYMRFGAGWHKNRRNIATVIFALLIANNGMVYYPFFTCILIGITVLCVALRDRKLKSIVPGLSVIALIAAWLAADFIPTVIGMLRGYGNVASNGAYRTAERAIGRGVDIKSLFLSPRGFIKGIGLRFYDMVLQTESEQYKQYLGIAAIIGFLILVIRLLTDRAKEKRAAGDDELRLYDRLGLLSKQTAVMLLIGAASGVGIIFAVIVPYITIYCRVHPYILFACVAAAGLCAECALRYFNKRRKSAYYGLAAFFIILCLYGLRESHGIYFYFYEGYSDGVKEMYEADREFFGNIEAESDDGDMIFMLPYMASFENGSVGNVGDYDHFRAYLHSDGLRFSFGAANGSENDIWYHNTAAMEPAEMAAELRDKGFAGVYVNLNAYEEDEGQALLEELVNVTGDDGYITDAAEMRIYMRLK